VRVNVLNKPGGNGAVAAAAISERKDDAHTLGLITSVWIAGPLTTSEAQVTVHDLKPIAQLMLEPAVFAVRADSPYKTLKEFVDAAKAKPGALKQSGGSSTSRDNIVRLSLQHATGAKWAFVSFPGGGERLAALLGGHVDMMIVDPSEAGEQIRGGKLRAIAQVSAQRLPGFKDIPTLQEAGFNIPDVPQMRGVVGAPGMPADAIAYYEDLFIKVSKTGTWQKFLTETHLDGEVVRSEDLKKFLASFEDQLRGILKEAGAKVVR
jgi:putative tricarboxylic transport membrane protein